MNIHAMPAHPVEPHFFVGEHGLSHLIHALFHGALVRRQLASKLGIRGAGPTTRENCTILSLTSTLENAAAPRAGLGMLGVALSLKLLKRSLLGVKHDAGGVLSRFISGNTRRVVVVVVGIDRSPRRVDALIVVVVAVVPVAVVIVKLS